MTQRRVNSHIKPLASASAFLVILLMFVFALPLHASAQNAGDLALPAPKFTVDALDAKKKDLQANPNLSDEQISQASDNYDTARAALESAVQNLEEAKRLQREIENTPSILSSLREEIDAANQKQTVEENLSTDVITGETLLKLQQDLITKEGDLRALRAEIATYNAELQSILQAPTRNALFDARTRLSATSVELDTMAEFRELDAMGKSRRYALEARQYALRAEVLALERDVAGLSGRQQILTHRRDLAELKANEASRAVIRLQNQTGQRRLSQAQAIQNRTLETLSVLESSNPILRNFAAENVVVSNKLIRIAKNASSAPKQQADTRSRSDRIKNDLDIARQLTELGNINRQSSATLRRLRNQRPSTVAVKNDIASTRKSILLATQDRLWAQEELRKYSIGQGLEARLSELEDGKTRINEIERDQFNVLYASRRNLLAEISDAAFASVAEGDDLLTLQLELLKHTEDLRVLLDQKLLWLPSVEAIDLSWPQRAMRGFFKVFSVDHVVSAKAVLFSQVRVYFPLVLLFSLVIGLIYAVRGRLQDDIREMAKNVGRVQGDSYWHTPKAVIASVINVAPIPMILFLVGILFKTSSSTDQFIQALGQTGIELSGFTLFFMTWRDWNRDKFLLESHFSLPKLIRHNLLKQLRWFIPVAGVTIALVTLTQNSREPDVHEGFSLLVFIMTAIALSYFSYKILWYRWSEFEKALANRDLVWRHRRSITFLIVGLPLLAGVLAAAGYYDTARELLSRLFFSAGVVVGAYVTYGIIRRTVLIAQRRIALRHAIERREKAQKARLEKEEAEERGEAPPPPVNYEEIDLEVLSRQSSQLLSTFVVLGFAILMWILWQDLLPALSVFDDVQLWPHMVTNSDGVAVKEWVSLWNIMQALAIVVITLLAARNLPGFLEVFILNRTGFDAGTRYAIVSVAGYTIVAIGIFMAFNKLGTEWSQFQWVVAALGVGIGFGLQEIIANFISGLIILFERPVRIGDYVTIGDQSGTITRIQIRATTLADLDNREILIPNKELITGRVTNWTLSNNTTRMIIRVGVAYGTDTDLARETILGAVRSNTKVLETPKPQVFFLGFGDSSLDFEIRVFLRSFEDRYPVSHHIHTDVYRALTAANISIPFPQRDLHIITPGPTSELPKSAPDDDAAGVPA